KWSERYDDLRLELPLLDPQHRPARIKLVVESTHKQYGKMPAAFVPNFMALVDNDRFYTDQKRLAIQATRDARELKQHYEAWKATQSQEEQRHNSSTTPDTPLSPEIQQNLGQRPVWLIRIDPEVMRILIGLYLTTAARLY